MIAAIDFYETVNAVGITGTDPTSEDVVNVDTDTSTKSFLRALVMFPE